MGGFLTQPVTEKISHDETHNHLEFGVSGMQGWRMSMEDAHSTLPDFDGKKNALFGVFDGHGGEEVAKYCAENFHKFLMDCDAFMDGNIKSALKDSFMNIDHAMTTDEVIEELKKISGINDSTEDEADEVAMLLEEANIPKEELLARFKENVKEKLKEFGVLEEEEVEIDEEEEDQKEVKEEEPTKKKERKEKENGYSETNINGSSTPAGGSTSSGSSSSAGGFSSSSTGDQVSSKGTENKEEEKDEDPDFEEGAEVEDEDEEDGDDEEEEEDDDDDDDDDEEEDDDDDEFEDGEGMDFQPGSEPGKDTGTTAIVALVYNNKLYVANVGDSRCVLCRNGKAIEMSVDHKPEDEVEKKRVEAAGAKITEGRVNGGLNMTRALGDHVYKQNKDIPPEDQAITALPDIEEMDLCKDDEFMVLACDGIWNVMTSDEVIDFVRERLQSNGKTDEKVKLSAICEELFDHCIAPNTDNDGTGCDNMTCMIVRFNHDQLLNGQKKRELIDEENDDAKRKSKKSKLT